MKSNYKRLGDYIRQVDVRNKEEKVTRLLGVSIDKKFIESIANTIGTDMSVFTSLTDFLVTNMKWQFTRRL